MGLPACNAVSAPAVIAGVGPLLSRFGGMCLVSDAQSVEH